MIGTPVPAIVITSRCSGWWAVRLKPCTNPSYVKQVVKRREPGVRPEQWTDFTVDVTADPYTDTTVESGKTYIYRVKALKSNHKGGESNRATATIP